MAKKAVFLKVGD